MVLLHGLLGSSRNWGGVAQALAGRWRVIAPDLPNHGASPWSETMDYPVMAREVARLIAERAGGRAAVIGHSMGGKVAMLLALTRPELVERLMVVDIAPVAYGHTFAPYIRAMRAAPVATARRRADVECAMHGIVDNPRVRAFLMQNLDGRPGFYRWRSNLAVLGAAMDDILAFPRLDPDAHYDGPALFLHGEESDYVLPAHEDLIAALFPAARIDSIAGAGHWLHADRPAEFQAALQAFLAG
ncbi:alpha/beta fold hydrolase [Magnetospirillum sp. UT-4]|uniref:alpha/beta fold hydrolase n=1 Tax=Magnetospirillum sp. UT-4 TaxID=2681467 RepID=UPI0013841514|nr:putative esterase [Magnetospirillum sp. UT-4]